MPTYFFEREVRTPNSESFGIIADGQEIGRVDLHFGLDVVHATLCVPEETTDEALQHLIGEIDERLVLTVHPYREDFVVTLWLGRPAGVFSEEFDEEYGDESEGNGHRE